MTARLLKPQGEGMDGNQLLLLEAALTERCLTIERLRWIARHVGEGRARYLYLPPAAPHEPQVPPFPGAPPGAAAYSLKFAGKPEVGVAALTVDELLDAAIQHRR